VFTSERSPGGRATDLPIARGSAAAWEECGYLAETNGADLFAESVIGLAANAGKQRLGGFCGVSCSAFLGSGWLGSVRLPNCVGMARLGLTHNNVLYHALFRGERKMVLQAGETAKQDQRK
jgi:hypothetical protein